MSHAEAATFLNAIHDTLARQPDLSPANPKVNSCLSLLIAMLGTWQRSGFGETLADHPDFSHLARKLPRLCGKAECEMEKWWCARILASKCRGVQSLGAFWYLENYKALCEAELRLLESRVTNGFVFLGGGALPLTAILIAQQRPEAILTCVDCDPEACQMAQDLVTLLGLSARITVKNMEACAYFPDTNEIAICASLLDAPGLYDHFSRCRLQRLIVRDAEGPYRFCYRPALLPGDAYIERAKSSISADRINTSRYFQARTPSLT